MVMDLQKLRRTVERRRKTNATAATRAGRPVRSVEELAALARDRRSVFCVGAWGLLPAVVVMNMAASQVHRAIQSGRMRRYTP
jgi:hypothetical protein